MLEKLNQLVEDARGLNRKLILLIGPHGSGKTNLLKRIGGRRQVAVLNVNIALGRQLLEIPASRRHFDAQVMLFDSVAAQTEDDLALLDNTELLFDRTLQLDPLDLLQRVARTRRVVAAWPGELKGNRLTYAMMGHSEYQDYGVEGLVLLEMK